MNILRHWKIIYTVCSLVFIGWMIHAGGNEFDRINWQYRRLNQQLEPARVESTALEQLTDECLKSRARTAPDEASCSAWDASLLEARVKIVAEQRLKAKQRGLIKIVLFYAGFVVIFLLAPVMLIYLLITALILLKKNIKFVR